MMRRMIGGLTASALAVLVGVLAVSACAIDKVPSLSVNGHTAVLNTAVPHTQAQLSAFTLFVFKQVSQAGQPAVLAENKPLVAQALVPPAMKTAPLWQLGDHTIARGWQVHHTFAHPGKYRVTVSAYYPPLHQWYQFDQVTLTVVAAHHTTK